MTSASHMHSRKDERHETSAPNISASCGGRCRAARAAARRPARKPIRRGRSRWSCRISAGGPADGLARPLAERMSKALGQPVVVENIPGAVGTHRRRPRARRRRPTATRSSFGHIRLACGERRGLSLPYDLRDRFRAGRAAAEQPLMISARKDFPAANLKELIAWLKANPGKVARRQCRAGQRHQRQRHLFPEHHRHPLPVRAAIKSVQTGDKALTAGELDLLFDQASHSLPYLRAGTIKVYAVTSKTRDGVRARRADHRRRRRCRASTAPTGTGCGRPRARRRRSSSASTAPWSRRWPIRRCVKQLSGQGSTCRPPDQRTPEALAAFHRAEIEKWWPILKAAGIKAK